MATEQSQFQALGDELATLRGGVGYTTITGRAFLRVTGPDATRWLNGMVSNSVQALAPGEGSYSFLLNAQGRILGDATVYRETMTEPAEFLLATTAAQADTLREHLDHFIIMDDVELTPACTDEAGLMMVGKEAASALAGLGLPAMEPLRMAHADTGHGTVLLLSPLSGLLPAFELWGASATITALRNHLCNGLPAGPRGELRLSEVSAAALEALRLLEGRPVYGQDIHDRDLPQETSQTHALHFAKGCYLGQEIVERIRSRGQVHRRFTSFRLSGDLPVSIPAPLEAGGKPAGEITSAGMIPLAEGSEMIALGYVRQEALDARQELAYAGGTAIVHRAFAPAG